MKCLHACKTVCVIALAVLIAVPSIAFADEVTFPVPTFTDAELAKVREWEKFWVGKKIDMKNVDQVAEYMLEPMVQVYKEPKRWGHPPEGIWFTITPYKFSEPTPGTLASTKKYAGALKMDEEGMIVNGENIAGVPFPVPKTGLEAAWNFDYRSSGDAYIYFRIGPNIQPGVARERTSKQLTTRVNFIHRTDVDPRPKVEDNPKRIAKGLFMHMYDPPENKNTRFFNIRHIDNKPDAGYIYYSPFRRMRRMGAASRTDTIDGTDMIYDDGEGYDGHILRNTYKLVGKKELLSCRNGDWSDWVRQPGSVGASGVRRERMNHYVVEAYHKDPDYVYGKRVWYLDMESYDIQWQLVYDKLGRLWKLFERKTADAKLRQGGTVKIEINSGMYDLQRTHGGFNTDEVRDCGIPYEEAGLNLFTVRNLQKTGY